MKNIYKCIILFSCLGAMSALLGACVKNQPAINRVTDVECGEVISYAHWSVMDDLQRQSCRI